MNRLKVIIPLLLLLVSIPEKGIAGENELSEGTRISMLDRALKPAEYIYEAGEARLEIELYPSPAEVVERYKKAYRVWCDSIYYSLVKRHVTGNDEEEFANETYSVLYSKLRFTYKPTMFLYEFLDSEKHELDCDLSAFIVFDIGLRLGMPNIKLVDVPGHVFVMFKNNYFETTKGIGECLYPLSEIKKRYPVIHFASSEVWASQAITFLVCGIAKLDSSWKVKYPETLLLEAGSDFSNALRYYPKYWTAMELRAEVYTLLGRFREAENDLNELEIGFRKSINSQYQRGLLYEKSAQFEEAVKCYRNAIEMAERIDSSVLYTYYNRAGVYEKMNRFQDAIDDYDYINRVYPNDTAMILRARAEIGQCEYGKAISTLTMVTNRNPTQPYAFELLADAWMGLEYYETAINFYNESLCLEPRIRRVYQGKGRALEGATKDEEALVSYVSSIRSVRPAKEGYVLLGNLSSKMGKHREAIEFFTAAIGYGLSCYVERAKVFEEMGEWDSASRDYDNALLVGEKLDEAMEGRSRMKKRLGDEWGAWMDGNLKTAEWRVRHQIVDM